MSKKRKWILGSYALLAVVSLAIAAQWSQVHGLYFAVVALANAYFITYSLRPWRKSPAGRALWIKAAANAFLVDFAYAAFLFGEYPGRDLLRIVGFSLFIIGLGYLLLVLLETPRWATPHPNARMQREEPPTSA